MEISNNIFDESMNQDEIPDTYGNLEKEEFKSLVTEHIENGEYETAVFWAEKVVALTSCEDIMERLLDVSYFMEILTTARKWQMIITYIHKYDLFLTHLVFSYFYVNALYHSGMYSEITNLPFGQFNRWEGVPFQVPESVVFLVSKHMQIENVDVQTMLDELLVKRKYEARFMLILAKTYIMVQNRMAASSCLKNCLVLNPHSSEALHIALNSRLLNFEQLKEIYNNAETQNKSGTQVMKTLLEIYNINYDKIQPVMKVLKNDLAIKSAQAYRLYYTGDMNSALNITTDIINEYGYYEKCFLIHVACLVFLKKANSLYVLGHKMVKLLPDMEVTWYTVGCYYYCTEQYSVAKKFLSKATTLNPGFGEGWLIYGHALFYAEEHEQAMNCYLRASRILEGHYEPLMYIGVEYAFGNNFKFANNFLNDAINLAGVNPIIIHEQANIFYMKQEYTIAEGMYNEVVRIITKTRNKKSPIETMCQVPVDPFWEPVFNNYGHVLRKLGKYQEAIFVHHLLMNNLHSEAWCCIGLCYASMKKLNEASEAFNKALAINPEDANAKTGLTKIYNFMANNPITLDSLNIDKTLDELLDERKENLGIVKEEMK